MLPVVPGDFSNIDAIEGSSVLPRFPFIRVSFPFQ